MHTPREHYNAIKAAEMLNLAKDEAPDGHLLGPVQKLGPQAMAILEKFGHDMQDTVNAGRKAEREFNRLREKFDKAKAAASAEIEALEPDLLDCCGYQLDAESGEFRRYIHITDEQKDEASKTFDDLISDINKKLH